MKTIIQEIAEQEDQKFLQEAKQKHALLVLIWGYQSAVTSAMVAVAVEDKLRADASRGDPKRPVVRLGHVSYTETGGILGYVDADNVVRGPFEWVQDRLAEGTSVVLAFDGKTTPSREHFAAAHVVVRTHNQSFNLLDVGLPKV